MSVLLRRKRTLALIMLISFTGITLCFSPAQAKLISTAMVLQGESQEASRARLKTFLQREQVQDRLAAWGLDREMAEARVDNLTDEEVAWMVQRLDQLPAGGDAASALIFAAVLIFLVLLFTDIMGFTDVFPFVKSHP